MILGDEEFDDVGRGKDGGLFKVFPYMKDHVTIREVMEREEDTEGSLVDFIEDDLGEREKKGGAKRKRRRVASDSEDDEEDDFEEDSDEDEVEDLRDEDVKEIKKGKRRSHSEKEQGVKRRKIIVISSGSDSDSS